MSIESRMNAAREIFFRQNPGLEAEIDRVDQAVIKAVGLDLEEYRAQRRVEVFADAARARGIDVGELAIQLVAESPEQAKEWRLEHHRRIAHALGVDWEDYKILNGISE